MIGARGLGLAGVAVVLALGCSVPSAQRAGAGGRPGDRGRDPLQGISVLQTKVAPQGNPAATYGGPVDHALSPTEKGIVDELSGLPMRQAPALSRMTRELARTAPDRVNIPPALVDGLMAWAGLVDPPPRLVVVELPEDTYRCDERRGPACDQAIGSLVEQVKLTLPEAEDVVFGVGVARVQGGATRMIVAVLERAVVLEPVASATDLGEYVTLRGRLLGERRDPAIELVAPDGTWTRLPSSVSVDGSFEAKVRCSAPAGAYQIEVLAEGQHGPEVAANFPLFCGVEAPVDMTVEVERLDAQVTAQQIAFANFVYLNEERERRGLPALEWDERAADVATAHSHDMQENGFVGHRSPSTGDVRERFTRARMQGSVIRENVARGYGPKGMHESLMGSPGHRVNMLASDVTHVGIGVVIGPPETNVAAAPRPLFCTQNFFRKPGAGAPPDGEAVATMQERVDAQRSKLGLPPAHWDPALTASAERLARTFARGRRPRTGWEKDLFAAGWNELETHQVRSPDFDALTSVKLWAQPQLSAGVGILRVREGKGTDFLMVVLVGER